MKKQRNNGGFSLLEVILAMAILAILSIPLLSYFTQSMRYNAKMADKQHATNLAQEVIENLKNQSNLVQNVTDLGFDIPYLTGKNYTQISYTPAVTGGSTITGGEALYYGAADAIGEAYDVQIKVGTAVSENTALVPQVTGIDDTKDVVAMESGQMQEALTYFCAKNVEYAAENHISAMSEAEIQKYLKRTISISVESTHVLVACSYQCEKEKVPGIDETDIYQGNDYAEEDIPNVEHIYLMYEVHQETDRIEIRCAAGIRVPKLVVVCQNIDDVNTLYASYKMIISPQDGCAMPKIASNLGKKSYSGSPTTNRGEIWENSYKLENIEALVEQKAGIRKVRLEVSVYKKNKGNEADKETYRYITVNTTKGE